MYFVNKLLWMFLSPVSILLIGMVVGLVLIRFNRSRWGWRLTIGCLVVLFVLSMPITAYVTGRGIEHNYLQLKPAEVPSGDVALDFGSCLERDWYAAEIVKAGRAPLLIASASGITNENAQLIHDLGIDERRLLLENEARNTEENVKFAKALYETNSIFRSKANPKVLVVSSATHLPRCMLTMAKYWPEAEAIPAPCDFRATKIMEQGFKWTLLKPDLQSLVDFESFYHEYVGWIYYRWLRK